MSKTPFMPTAKDFSGSVPEAYDQYLGPFCFQPFAEELASRLPKQERLDILELACGTGVLTEELHKRRPSDRLVATDLSDGMLAVARKRSTLAAVEFKIADAQELPFDDASFDVVACQFGWMMFPEKPTAAQEALRVLRPGGLLIFDVWDGLPANPPFDIASEVIAPLFDGEKRFSGPFGYNDIEAAKQVLTDAGFVKVEGERVAKVGVADSAESVAKGQLLGTPMYQAILERDGSALEPSIARLTERLAEAFGDRPLRAPLQAIFVWGRGPG